MSLILMYINHIVKI